MAGYNLLQIGKTRQIQLPKLGFAFVFGILPNLTDGKPDTYIR